MTHTTPRHVRLALGLTVLAGMLAGLLRLLPGTEGFSSLGALGLLGGALLPLGLGLGLPLLVMLLTDLGLWLILADPLYSPFHLSRVYVYGSLLIYVLLGCLLVRKITVPRVAVASFLGGLQFFLVTNFCYWLLQPLEGVPEMYRLSRDLDGLLRCYIDAVPFYRLGILGDLVFSGALFGMFAYLSRPARVPVPEEANWA